MAALGNGLAAASPLDRKDRFFLRAYVPGFYFLILRNFLDPNCPCLFDLSARFIPSRMYPTSFLTSFWSGGLM
jgi:hypothetical protein